MDRFPNGSLYGYGDNAALRESLARNGQQHQLLLGSQSQQHSAAALFAQQQRQQQYLASMGMGGHHELGPAALLALQQQYQQQQQQHQQHSTESLLRAAQLQGALGGLSGHELQLLQQELMEQQNRELLARASGAGNAGSHSMEMQRLLAAAQQHQQEQNLAEQVKSSAALARTKPADVEGEPKETTEISRPGDEPGSILLPCRARGMPMDHNFKTAYFVIPAPDGLEHGAELICSHEACRLLGSKFRYCAVCKAPVAKRNFKRHDHGMGRNKEKDDDGASEEGSEVSATRNREGKAISQIVSDSTENSKVKKPKFHPPEGQNGKKEDARGSNSSSGGDSLTVTVTEREHRWLMLIRRRPETSDGKAMSAWLAEVLSVSDTKSPATTNSQAAKVPDASTPANPINAAMKKSTAPTRDGPVKNGLSNMPPATNPLIKKRDISNISKGGSKRNSPVPQPSQDAPPTTDATTSRKKTSPEGDSAATPPDESKQKHVSGSHGGSQAAASTSKEASASGGGGFAAWKIRKKQKLSTSLGTSQGKT